jgi:hypothetical protein
MADHACAAGQVGKVLGERWKALSASERKPYDDKAKVDKERYENDKAAYAVRHPHPTVRRPKLTIPPRPAVTRTRMRNRPVRSARARSRGF